MLESYGTVTQFNWKDAKSLGLKVIWLLECRCHFQLYPKPKVNTKIKNLSPTPLLSPFSLRFFAMLHLSEMLSLPHGYHPNAVCIDSWQQNADWLPNTVGCLLEEEVFSKIKLFSLARRRNKVANSSNTKPLWLKFIVPKEALVHWSFQILKTGKAAKLNRKEGKNF